MTDSQGEGEREREIGSTAKININRLMALLIVD